MECVQNGQLTFAFFEIPRLHKSRLPSNPRQLLPTCLSHRAQSKILRQIHCPLQLPSGLVSPIAGTEQLLNPPSDILRSISLTFLSRTYQNTLFLVIFATKANGCPRPRTSDGIHPAIEGPLVGWLHIAFFKLFCLLGSAVIIIAVAVVCSVLFLHSLTIGTACNTRLHQEGHY